MAGDRINHGPDDHCGQPCIVWNCGGKCICRPNHFGICCCCRYPECEPPSTKCNGECIDSLCPKRCRRARGHPERCSCLVPSHIHEYNEDWQWEEAEEIRMTIIAESLAGEENYAALQRLKAKKLDNLVHAAFARASQLPGPKFAVTRQSFPAGAVCELGFLPPPPPSVDFSKQRQRSKKNKTSCLVEIPRGCIPLTQAATITTRFHTEGNGTVTFKHLVAGCQLCQRQGIDVKKTSTNWVLCLSCKKGSQENLTEQLEGIREAMLSPIQSECKGQACDQCRDTKKRASAYGDYSFHDATREARIKLWCPECRATIKRKGVVPTESSMQGTHVAFAELRGPPSYQ